MRHDPRRDDQGLAANAVEAEVVGAIAGSSILRRIKLHARSLIIVRNVPASTNHSLWLILIP
jgi:hypothetical protein